MTDDEAIAAARRYLDPDETTRVRHAEHDAICRALLAAAERIKVLETAGKELLAEYDYPASAKGDLFGAVQNLRKALEP